MSKTRSSTDQNEVIELIKLIRQNDQNAFKVLVEKYDPLIDSLVFKFYDKELKGLTPDDLRQEAVLRFYNSILTFDLEQHEVEFGLYAKICISNALISQIRLQKKRTAEQLTEFQNVLFFEHDSEDPSDRILEEERVRTLYSLIRKNLSPYEYRIWQLYMSGRTAKDICILVDSDERSVSNAIYRIRKKLRALLL